MILLVDTSVWIDFFAGRDTPQTRYFKDAIGEGADVALTGVILAEILQGIPSDSEFARPSESFVFLPDSAAGIGRNLRAGGEALPGRKKTRSDHPQSRRLPHRRDRHGTRGGSFA